MFSFGWGFYLALKKDGSIIADGEREWGATEVPAGNDFVAISAGAHHGVALKKDESLAAWGSAYAPVPSGNDYVAVDAGSGFSVALKKDGSLVAWGLPYYGQTAVPAGNDFVAVSAGQSYAVALKTDGSLVAWGSDFFGRTVVPPGNDFVAIAAGAFPVVIEVPEPRALIALFMGAAFVFLFRMCRLYSLGIK